MSGNSDAGRTLVNLVSCSRQDEIQYKPHTVSPPPHISTCKGRGCPTKMQSYSRHVELAIAGRLVVTQSNSRWSLTEAIATGWYLPSRAVQLMTTQAALHCSKPGRIGTSPLTTLSPSPTTIGITTVVCQIQHIHAAGMGMPYTLSMLPHWNMSEQESTLLARRMCAWLSKHLAMTFEVARLLPIRCLSGLGI
jgi:hypothetical protein